MGKSYRPPGGAALTWIRRGAGVQRKRPRRYAFRGHAPWIRARHGGRGVRVRRRYFSRATPVLAALFTSEVLLRSRTRPLALAMQRAVTSSSPLRVNLALRSMV